jgi:D-xylose transport system permease protein
MLWILGPTGSHQLPGERHHAGLLDQSSFFPDQSIYGAYGLALVVVLGVRSCSGARSSTAVAGKAAGVPARPLSRDHPAHRDLLAVLAFAVAIVLNQYQGLPLALVVFLAVFLVITGLRAAPHLVRPEGVRLGRRRGGGPPGRHQRVRWIRITVFMPSPAPSSAIGGMFYAGSLTNSVQSLSVRWRQHADARDRGGRHRRHQPVRWPRQHLLGPP